MTDTTSAVAWWKASPELEKKCGSVRLTERAGPASPVQAVGGETLRRYSELAAIVVESRLPHVVVPAIRSLSKPTNIVHRGVTLRFEVLFRSVHQVECAPRVTPGRFSTPVPE